ncbi:hypothetical protein SAMN04488021_103113 [Paracoccus aminovorans]|uniref:Uncharacterized protein n=1 Tax=Paracoccus aminovorans TaxID=34004 RepID=A0A1I2Y878_9RHOB|nr:hypothetical protein [Paracoccus aminovorans]CQR86148.1 hypothetical protein JCM7685_1579 [Paracoccus aminovorans]SFH21832.1 hypothetical protein SAMN04488021_103113 [Paracoccus aminovorans]
MSNPPLPRVTERPAAPKPPRLDSATEQLVERLRSARTANEMAEIVGLKPIKGRSGPKIAY